MKRPDRNRKQVRDEDGAANESAPSRRRERREEVRKDAHPRSRREFMRLMAAGASAMLAAPAAAAVKTAVKKAPADTTARVRRTRTGEGGSGNHPMLPAELEKQKKFTADSLKTLRNYSLPPGAAPAYLFRPLAQKSRRARP